MISADGDELSAQRRTGGKSEAAFRTISEVSEDLDVPQHVLRFWESKFAQIKPLKRGGGRRYYRPDDVALLRRIRDLLYQDGYTIKGVQKLLRDQGRGASEGAHAASEAADAGEDEPEQHGLFDAGAPAAVSRENADVEAMGDGEEVDPPSERVWVRPAPPPPLSPTSPHFRSSDRIILIGILEELEELRDLLSASRRGG